MSSRRLVSAIGPAVVLALANACGSGVDTASQGRGNLQPDEHIATPTGSATARAAVDDDPVENSTVATTEVSVGAGGSPNQDPATQIIDVLEPTHEPIIVEAGDAGAAECGAVRFSVATKQACAIDVIPGMDLDGEGFIQIEGMDYRVFAMNRLGTGHVAAWCDGTTLRDLLLAYDVIGYLGSESAPSSRIASFGGYPCQGALPTVGDLPVTYWGTALPTEYLNDPEKLAADWDVVTLCGHHIEWDAAWPGVLESFASDHGGGLLLAMDYLGNEMQTSGITVDDFRSLSAVNEPAGFFFPPANLPHADATSSVDLDCVPDAPGVKPARLLDRGSGIEAPSPCDRSWCWLTRDAPRRGSTRLESRPPARQAAAAGWHVCDARSRAQVPNGKLS
jgi:hypothetical protein